MRSQAKPVTGFVDSKPLAIQDPREFQDDVIVMIDDEPLMLEILEIYLTQEGYRNFIKVENSTRALEVLHLEKPDCVFLDINMPEVDGFEILEKLRSNPDTMHLAVIVLTSDTDPSTKLRALELGATDFLEKPIDSSELILRLRNTLKAKAYQDQLTYCDGLTQLPNRALFQERLRAGVAHAKRASDDLSLLVVSVDRFQKVNDSLGPMAGDSVLQEIAWRLGDIVKDAGYNGRKGQEGTARCLARLGGDEFAISLPGVRSKDKTLAIANQIREAIKRPFEYRGRQVLLTASVGIAMYPDDSADAGQLLMYAGAAKELAKKTGRDNLQYYTPEITQQAEARRSLEADLHKAVQKNELRLHFQPLLKPSGHITGMEALVRWQHPERGMVPAGDFIPLAEESDLIIPIGAWVMEQACRQARRWQDAGYAGLGVSVNLSPRQFNHPNLVESIAAVCDKTRLAPEFLTIEVTESLIMGDVDRAARLLEEMQDIGVSIAIDDFGTGYSSLAYLKRFPIHKLKIDRSFLTDVPGGNDDEAIVRTMVTMAHTLDLTVTAEGVETSEQLEFLQQLNCDELQGYLLGEPMAEADFTDFLRTNWKASERSDLL
jgi:diguanylate cyclase (GGDEF)-like protein